MDKTLISASVAILLWLLTRWVQMGAAWARRRQERRNLIRSLYTEVDFNTRDLSYFVANSADMSAIANRLRQNDDFLPHVTDAHHTIIYTSNVNKLHHLSNGLSADLVLFYGLLEKIKAQIDGINLTSFQRISAEGKIATMRRIVENVKECETIGRRILKSFSDTYPKYKMTRHARHMVDLKQR